MSPDATDNDLDFDLQVEVSPLIPDGQYDVAYVRSEKKWMWRGWKLFLWFQVTTLGEYNGVKLYMPCNLPTGKKIRDSSKLGRAWILALGQKPDRFDRFSTKVFRGKCFQAQVRRVLKSSKQSKLTPEQQYSIIDEITEKVAG